MDTSLLLAVVQWTARLSGLAFSLACVALTFARWDLGRATGRDGSTLASALFALFTTSHVLHFMAVVALGLRTGGANMFPGGRSVADVGGWGTVVVIFGVFYAMSALWWWHATKRSGASRWLRAGGTFAALFIGYAFATTYTPLIEVSAWYAVPVAAVVGAVVAYLVRTWWVTPRLCPLP